MRVHHRQRLAFFPASWSRSGLINASSAVRKSRGAVCTGRGARRSGMAHEVAWAAPTALYTGMQAHAARIILSAGVVALTLCGRLHALVADAHAANAPALAHHETPVVICDVRAPPPAHRSTTGGWWPTRLRRAPTSASAGARGPAPAASARHVVVGRPSQRCGRTTATTHRHLSY
jgi:hypothetical protein